MVLELRAGSPFRESITISSLARRGRRHLRHVDYD